MGLSYLQHYGVTLPAAPAKWEGPPDEGFNYGMLGNDSYGDCGPCGIVHGFDAVAILEGLPPFKPAAQDVVDAYLAFTGGQDTGVVLSDLLQKCYVAGFMGQHLLGYAPINGGVAQVCQALPLFGFVYSGFQMPAVAQQQFGAGQPFDLTGTSEDDNIEGGHCMVPVAFDASAQTVDVLTWGRRQTVTFRWYERYNDENWAPVTRMVRTRGGLDGFKWDQLDADLRSLSGAVGA